MVNLKRNLVSILKNFNNKSIIYLLIGLVFIFLICGNYNLVEGLTLDEMSSQLNNKRAETNDGGNLQKDVSKLYTRENGKRKNLLNSELGGMVKPKNVVEGFLEGMKVRKNSKRAGINQTSDSMVFLK